MEEVISQIKLEFESDHPNKWGYMKVHLKKLIASNRLDLLITVIYDCEALFKDKHSFNDAPDYVGFMFLVDKEKGDDWLKKAEAIAKYSNNYCDLAEVAFRETEDLNYVLELLRKSFNQIYDAFNEEEYEASLASSILWDLLYSVQNMYLTGKENLKNDSLKISVKPIFKESFEFLEKVESYESLVYILEDEDFGFANETEWIQKLKDKI